MLLPCLLLILLGCLSQLCHFLLQREQLFHEFAAGLHCLGLLLGSRIVLSCLQWSHLSLRLSLVGIQIRWPKWLIFVRGPRVCPIDEMPLIDARRGIIIFGVRHLPFWVVSSLFHLLDNLMLLLVLLIPIGSRQTVLWTFMHSSLCYICTGWLQELLLCRGSVLH